MPNLQKCVSVSGGWAYFTNRYLILRERVDLEDQVIPIATLDPDRAVPICHYVGEHYKSVVSEYKPIWLYAPTIRLTGEGIYKKAQAARKADRWTCQYAGSDFNPTFLTDIFRRIPRAEVQLFSPNSEEMPRQVEGPSLFQWEGGEALIQPIV